MIDYVFQKVMSFRFGDTYHFRTEEKILKKNFYFMLVKMKYLNHEFHKFYGK